MVLKHLGNVLLIIPPNQEIFLLHTITFSKLLFTIIKTKTGLRRTLVIKMCQTQKQ